MSSPEMPWGPRQSMIRLDYAVIKYEVDAEPVFRGGVQASDAPPAGGKLSIERVAARRAWHVSLAQGPRGFPLRPHCQRSRKPCPRLPEAGSPAPDSP